MAYKKRTLEEFIVESEKVHGKIYDYSNSVYIKSTIKIDILCKKHGEFSIFPQHHLRGGVCPFCNTNNSRLNKEEFVKRSINIHGNKYDYFHTNYKNNATKVNILCKSHGEFLQTPQNHLCGQGCPKCAKEATRNISWGYSSWGDCGIKSKRFDSFKVYVIECYNNYERFIKIGKTFNTIDNRFDNSIKMPYSWDIVKIYEGSPIDMCNLEKKLHKTFKELKYNPILPFDGSKECFYIQIKDKLNG